MGNIRLRGVNLFPGNLRGLDLGINKACKLYEKCISEEIDQSIQKYIFIQFSP